MTTIAELIAASLKISVQEQTRAIVGINKDLIRLLAAEYEFDPELAIAKFLDDDYVIPTSPSPTVKVSKGKGKKVKKIKKKPEGEEQKSETEEEEEEILDPPDELVALFHKKAFAPRLDLSQSEINSLDGSTLTDSRRNNDAREAIGLPSLRPGDRPASPEDY